MWRVTWRECQGGSRWVTNEFKTITDDEEVNDHQNQHHHHHHRSAAFASGFCAASNVAWSTCTSVTSTFRFTFCNINPLLPNLIIDWNRMHFYWGTKHRATCDELKHFLADEFSITEVCGVRLFAQN
jgi:hypothetical protein